MYNLNLLSNYNVAKNWEERENRGKRAGAVDDKERNVIDLEAIREIPHTSATFVCMCYDDDLMPSVDELGGELVNMTLDSAWLWKEEVADHGNIVRHCD